MLAGSEPIAGGAEACLNQGKPESPQEGQLGRGTTPSSSRPWDPRAAEPGNKKGQGSRETKRKGDQSQAEDLESWAHWRFLCPSIGTGPTALPMWQPGLVLGSEMPFLRSMGVHLHATPHPGQGFRGAHPGNV